MYFATPSRNILSEPKGESIATGYAEPVRSLRIVGISERRLANETRLAIKTSDVTVRSPVLRAASI